MKKICVLLLVSLLFVIAPAEAAKKNKVIINDFTGVNLFDSFYVYDNDMKCYKFVPLSRLSYLKLTKENKAIYNRVVSADNDWQSSETARTYRNSMNYLQDAFKKNPDLLPVADLLVKKFQADRKYNTALFYAEKIKKKDNRNRYPDIDYTLGELNYQIKEYQIAMEYFIQYVHENPKTKSRKNLENAYFIIGDCYLNLYRTQLKTPYKLKQGIKYIDKSLAITPDNIKALEIKYNLCMEAQDYDCANEVVRIVRQIEPNYQLKFGR